MGELLFWTAAVFTVLAGPPLVLLLLDLQRPRRLEQQRRLEQARGDALPQKAADAGSSAAIGVWPGALLLAWIVRPPQ